MISLKYHVRLDTTGYVWEVLTDSGTLVVKGYEADLVAARASAMRAGMRELSAIDERPRLKVTSSV
jgi:hypothetical protein